MSGFPRRAALAAALGLPATGAITAAPNFDAALMAACADYQDAVEKLAAWDRRADQQKGSAEALAEEASGGQLCDREHEAIIRVGSLPAQSVPALRAKALMLGHVMDWGIRDCVIDDASPQAELARSLAADVLRLLGGAA